MEFGRRGGGEFCRWGWVEVSLLVGYSSGKILKGKKWCGSDDVTNDVC